MTSSRSRWRSDGAVSDSILTLESLGCPEERDPAFVGAIVAMNSDRVIGVDGDMPWHYSADLKRFKRLTIGSSIIMGRKTWDAIGRRELPGRKNVVITRGSLSGVTHYNSLERAMSECPGPQWIIGGAQIYAAALPMCHMLDITWVPDRITAQTTVRFPELSPEAWLAGSRVPLEEDERLINQRFFRRPS